MIVLSSSGQVEDRRRHAAIPRAPEQQLPFQGPFRGTVGSFS